MLSVLLVAAVIVFPVMKVSAADGGGKVHSITLPNVPPDLKPGPGRDKVETYCAICHSPDYIPMQPLFPEKKWGEIVTKMIKVFGAPIPPEAAREITTYLGKEYSPQK